MATFKVVAYYSKRDGSANIKIRVLHHDAQRRVATGLHALPGDVTPNGRIKSASLQRQCDALLHRCLALANELSPRLAAMSIDELAERVRATITGDSAFRLDFLGYIREVAGKMNRGTGSLYITAANALCRFIKRDTLDVSEVTGKLLRDFMEFLRTEPSQRGSNRRGVGEALPKGGRAVSLYMARLRAAYNRASLEFNEPEHGVLCIPPSPFERIHIDAPAPPRKRALAPAIMQRILDLPLFDDRDAQLARDCFVLSFALAGMNAADMLTARAPEEGVVTYERQKTRTRRQDRAEMRLRIEKYIAPLMEQYADPAGKRLFCLYRRFRNRETFVRVLNKGLREVAAAVGVEHLTFYAARHTWATIAATSRESGGAGIDMYTVHCGLNHVDSRMKITEVYVVRDWRPVWDANRAVLELFDWTEIELRALL